MSISLEAVPLPFNLVDGVIRLSGTRVTLDTVVYAYLEGATAEEIVQRYPSVNLADIHVSIAYYLHHKQEVDRYLMRRKEESVIIRQQNEKRFPPEGIRARLLARRQS